MSAVGQRPYVVTFGRPNVEVRASRESGTVSGDCRGIALKTAAKDREIFGFIFVTGASQLAALVALSRIRHLPWHCVRRFHMNDYVGLPVDHPASFHAYFRDNLVDCGQMKSFMEGCHR